MFIVLTVVFLAVGIGLLLWNHFGRYDEDNSCWWVNGTFGIISILAGAVCMIALLCCIPKVATEATYDTRIEIVQESNAQVEVQICSAVEKYLEHEENVYEKLDVTTAIGLCSAYPNLKSNELVQSLIDTYRANTDEIKALKMDKANLAVIKFLVYLGIKRSNNENSNQQMLWRLGLIQRSLRIFGLGVGRIRLSQD